MNVISREMGHFDQRSHLLPKNHSPKEFFEHAIILDSLSKVFPRLLTQILKIIIKFLLVRSFVINTSFDT